MVSVGICPDCHRLLDYALGNLSDHEIDAIARHVNDCGDCLAQLDALEQVPDPVLKSLKDPVWESDYVREPECERGIAECAALTQQTGNAVSTEQLGSLRDYRLIREIGRGGMGTVYEAIHVPLDRRVALKVLPADRMQNHDAVSRFQREMRAIGKLDHPNIVRAQDAGEENGKHFLVMELVEGFDLAALASHIGPLPISDACELIRQGAIGLAHAHEQGLVHRDVKPSNLIVTPAGTVKVLDLGLALLSESLGRGEELTSSGQVMGTIDYMAPEQLGDSHEVDARADIYGLGATLYRLLTGQAPYSDKRYSTPTKQLMAIATKPIAPVSEHRDDVPKELLAVLDRTLAKNPDERFATAAEVFAALSAFTSTSDLPALVARAIEQQKPTTSAAAPTISTLDHAGSPMADTQAPPIGPKFRRSLDPQVSRRRYSVSIAAVVLLLLSGAALTGIVVRLRTPEGTIIVTVDEAHDVSDLIVEVDGDRTVSVRVIEGGRALRITVPPGERLLRIETVDGVALLTKEFTLERGGTRVAHVGLDAPSTANDRGAEDALRSQGVDSAEQGFAVADVPTPELSLTGRVSNQRDREAAERVLACGGKVVVWAPGVNEMDVGNAVELPDRAFRLVRVNLSNCEGFKGEDFELFHDLPDLAAVILQHVKGADEFLSSLGHLPALRHLDLGETDITDRHLAELPRTLKLESLCLNGTFVTDEGLRYLEGLHDLKSLDLGATRISDFGLGYLADKFHFEYLRLPDTHITDAGFKSLAEMGTLTTVHTGTGFTDTAAKHLAQLKGLREIDASWSAITDEGVTTLASIDNLEVVRLVDTQITDAAVQHIETLTKLRELSLEGCSVSDDALKPLAALRNLQSLNLSATPITDDAVELLMQFPALDTLYIQDTWVTADAYYRLQPFVRAVIWIDKNRIAAKWLLERGGRVQLSIQNQANRWLQSVEDLPHESFRLIGLAHHKDFAHESFQPIYGSPYITHVNLSASPAAKEFLSHVDQFPSLEELVLRDAPVTDRHVAHLTAAVNLTHVELVGTLITDNAMETLASLPQLQHLSLQYTSISDEGVARLSEAPRLGSLVIGVTKITDNALTYLSQMQSLRDIDLNGQVAVTDEGIKQLVRSNKLRALDATGTSITDAGIAHLSASDSLEVLSIAAPQVTDEAAPHLVRLENLRHLVINANFLTERSIKQLILAQKLMSLYVQMDQSAAPDEVVPRHLSELKRLQSLHLADEKHITDVWIEHLTGLSSLEYLGLQNTRISQAGFDRLKEALPGCNIIWEPPQEEPDTSTDGNHQGAE